MIRKSGSRFSEKIMLHQGRVIASMCEGGEEINGGFRRGTVMPGTRFMHGPADGRTRVPGMTAPKKDGAPVPGSPGLQAISFNTSCETEIADIAMQAAGQVGRIAIRWPISGLASFRWA